MSDFLLGKKVVAPVKETAPVVKPVNKAGTIVEVDGKFETRLPLPPAAPTAPTWEDTFPYFGF